MKCTSLKYNIEKYRFLTREENSQKYKKTVNLRLYIVALIGIPWYSKAMKNTMMYKEYSGTIEFSEEEMRFYGMVTGIRTKIFFHGNTADELYTAFTQAVDSYMEECNAKGILPEKPLHGNLQRTHPLFHPQGLRGICRKPRPFLECCGEYGFEALSHPGRPELKN